jgi:TonB family protein
MFQTLIASAPSEPPSLTRLLASIGLHALVLSAALALTAMHPTVIMPPREARMPFVLPPLRQNHPQPTPLGAPQSTFRAPAPLLPVTGPPPLAPPEIRSSGPTVAEVLAGVSQSEATRAVATWSPSGVTAPSSGLPRDELEVDDPVQLLEQPSVRYPPALAHAGVAGRVELEFVVDTLGRVEPRSVRTLASAQPEFEAAARRAILVSRFRPAHWHGQVVRQVARPSFRFRTTPSRSSERDQ